MKKFMLLTMLFILSFIVVGCASANTKGDAFYQPEIDNSMMEEIL